MAQKWEYKQVVTRVEAGAKVTYVEGQTAGIKTATDVLNELGAQGWELVSTTGDANEGMYMLKRARS